MSRFIHLEIKVTERLVILEWVNKMAVSKRKRNELNVVLTSTVNSNYTGKGENRFAHIIIVKTFYFRSLGLLSQAFNGIFHSNLWFQKFFYRLKTVSIAYHCVQISVELLVRDNHSRL